MQLEHETQKHNLQIQATFFRFLVNLPRRLVPAQRLRHIGHHPAVDHAVRVERLREQRRRALEVLFGPDAPRAVHFARGEVVHEQLAEEVGHGLPRVRPHAGVEAEFERIFDFFLGGAGVAFLVVEGGSRDGEGFGLDGGDAALRFGWGGGDEEFVQFLLVPFDEVVGLRDKDGFQLVGGEEELVFGEGGAFAAFAAAAAEEVLVAEFGLADAEGVGGVDVFDEELVALFDGFEGAEKDLGLVEEDDEVGLAAVVGAADYVVEPEAEGDVVQGACEGDGVAVDLL